MGLNAELYQMSITSCQSLKRSLISDWDNKERLPESWESSEFSDNTHLLSIFKTYTDGFLYV